MKRSVLATTFALVLIATPLCAAGVSGPYQLNVEGGLGGFSEKGLFLNATCRVDQKGDASYAYTVKLEYKSDQKRLLSWNFLDWILSQYPNAIERGHADPHLFPIEGSGTYTFTFQSAFAPFWTDKTLLTVFPAAPSTNESEAENEERAGWSGAHVSSYKYLSSELGMGFGSCVPSNLRMFLYGSY